MAKRKKAQSKTLRRWDAGDIKVLRQHAGKKTIVQIARALKRTPAAIRIKASDLQLSLALR
jgi:hypothetical protein